MHNKLTIICVSLGIVLGGMGQTFAGNDFTNGGGDHLWTNPNNWSMSVVPENATLHPGEAVPQWMNDVGMVMDDTICIVDANASAYHVMVGAYGGENKLEMTGGTLTIGQWGLDIGRGGNGNLAHEGSSGEVLMTGGEIITTSISIPMQWTQPPLIKGLLWMQGGFVRTDALTMGAEGGQGRVYLDGGTVRVDGPFTMHGGSAWMDFREGTLIVAGDQTETIQGYMNSGWISAYEGQGTLVLEYTGTDTILTAQTADSLKATTPRPGNYSTVNSLGVTFSWTTGAQTQRSGGHDLYIGTHLDDVTHATRIDHPNVEYVNLDDNSYGPMGVEFGKTYYWRVDQINNSHPDKLWPGTVWAFTVAEYGLVDDMESYGFGGQPGVPGGRIWYTWKDGQGWTNPAPGWGGNGTGSSVNLELTADRVHEGEQSLLFEYNTFSKPKAEIRADTADLAIGSNWAGAKSVELWFYGDVANLGGKQMYVALQDAVGQSHTVPYSGDANDIKLEQWQPWRIGLDEFVGVDLSDVRSMSIGLGMPGDPAGGSGTVYFDDITVHPCRPGGLAFDFNGDCVVDYQDMAIMAEDWLNKKLSP